MSFKPKTFLITGGNRGLGFEMVNQILKKYSPKAIFATYRDVNSAEELHKLANANKCIHPVKMDVKDPSTFSPVFDYIEKTTESEGLGLDVLINNAGIYSSESQTLKLVSKELMNEYFNVNLFGALFVTQKFVPLLEKAGKINRDFKGSVKILNLSSRLGSIDDNKSGGFYASRCSRAALNATTKSMSLDLKDKNIFVAAVNPGWVQTDQGGSKAPLTSEQSVSGLLNVLNNLNESNTGNFIQYDGQIIPW